MDALKQSIKDEIIANIIGYFNDRPSLQREQGPFLASCQNKIDRIAQQMIDEYERDGELEELYNRAPDWVREYMDPIYEELPDER